MKIKVLKSDCYHIENITNVACCELPFEMNGHSIILIIHGDIGTKMYLGDIFGSYFYGTYDVWFNGDRDSIIFTTANTIMCDTPVDIRLTRLSDIWT